MSINSVVLNNGVMLITEPIATAKTVAIGFYFSVGSRSETAENRGITHFVEHLLFKGTKSRTSFEIAKTFDRMGGYSNAFTEKENMSVYCTVPAVAQNGVSYPLLALDVLCDMTQNCVFDENEIEKERDVVKNEILSVEDDFEESAYEAASGVLWQNHNLGNNISGSVEEVSSITRAQIIDFYEKNIASGELVVCVAGNFVEDDFVSRLEKLGEHKRAGESVLLSRFSGEKPSWKSGVFSKKSDFLQKQLFVLYEAKCPSSEKEYFSQVVLNAVLGDTMSSRLFQSLREKSGLCYNVYSFISLYEDVGVLGAYLSAEKSKVKKAYSALTAQIENLLQNPPDDDELDFAKEHLCGEEIMGEPDMEAHLKRLYRNYAMGFPQRSADETISLIRSINANDVKEAISAIFKNPFIFLYGSKSKLALSC